MTTRKTSAKLYLVQIIIVKRVLCLSHSAHHAIRTLHLAPYPSPEDRDQPDDMRSTSSESSAQTVRYTSCRSMSNCKVAHWYEDVCATSDGRIEWILHYIDHMDTVSARCVGGDVSSGLMCCWSASDTLRIGVASRLKSAGNQIIRFIIFPAHLQTSFLLRVASLIFLSVMFSIIDVIAAEPEISNQFQKE